MQRQLNSNKKNAIKTAFQGKIKIFGSLVTSYIYIFLDKTSTEVSELVHCLVKVVEKNLTLANGKFCNIS